eukprot:jgi/Botrbrau1/20529/Bobra.145_2s0078.4
MRTNMIQTLLPFSDCLLEEDFRRRFHNRRAVLDIVTAAFVMYHVSKYMLSGETKGMDPTLFALWISLTIAEILVMCGTFHPGKPPLMTVPSHPGKPLLMEVIISSSFDSGPIPPLNCTFASMNCTFPSMTCTFHPYKPFAGVVIFQF